MGYQISERSRRYYAFGMLFFLGVSLTFLIISVSLHNLYSTRFDDAFPGGGLIVGEAHVGAFTMCFDLDNAIPGVGSFSVHDCPQLKSDCSATFKYRATNATTGEVTEGTLNSSDDPENNGSFNCTQFNAFRAFFIMSIIFTGLALIAMMFYLKNATVDAVKSRRWFITTIALIVIQWLCLVITWGIVADHITTFENSGAPGFSKGPAFGLAISAWCITFLSLVLLIAYRMFDPEQRASREGTKMTGV